VADERVMLVPRVPYRASPCARSLVVIIEVRSADEMKDSELTGSVFAFKHWKVLAALEHAAEHDSRLTRRHSHLKDGTQASEMGKHRLATLRSLPSPGC
jgi:hypothetical protein